MKKAALSALEDEFGTNDDTTAKPKVVVVDDDKLLLAALKVVLEKNYEVECFSTAEEGVKAAVKEDVAAVVLDIKMPEFDGFWAFRQIRASGSKVPIIFNSAYQDMVLPDELKLHYKPYAFLAKSGDVREFMASVEAAVHEHHARRSPR